MRYIAKSNFYANNKGEIFEFVSKDEDGVLLLGKISGYFLFSEIDIDLLFEEIK